MEVNCFAPKHETNLGSGNQFKRKGSLIQVWEYPPQEKGNQADQATARGYKTKNDSHQAVLQQYLLQTIQPLFSCKRHFTCNLQLSFIIFFNIVFHIKPLMACLDAAA